MKTIDESIKAVRKHFQTLIQSKASETVFGFRRIEIPYELITDELSKRGTKEIFIEGEQYHSHQQVYSELRAIPNLEYLKDDQLKERIDGFTCELVLAGKKYKDKVALQEFTTRFVNALVKPFVEYEIYIGISNIKLTIDSVDLGGVTLFNSTPTFLEGLREAYSRKIAPASFAAFENVVAMIKESGNSSEKAKYRATQKLIETLALAKIVIQQEEFLESDRIEMNLSELTVVKKMLIPPQYFWHWKRTDRAEPIYFGEPDHIQRYSELAAGFEHVDSEFLAKIKMSLHWINLAYSEPNYEIKTIFICTAMECILSSRADKKKGAILAFRIFIIATHFGATMLPADKFYGIYILRSYLIHGSKTEVGAEKEYTELLLESQNTIRKALSLCKHFSIKNQKQFFKMLDELPAKQAVINHMEKWQSSENQEILRELGLSNHELPTEDAPD